MPQPVTASFPFKSILRIRLTISPKHKHTHEHNNYTNTHIHILPVGVFVSVVSLQSILKTRKRQTSHQFCNGKHPLILSLLSKPIQDIPLSCFTSYKLSQLWLMVNVNDCSGCRLVLLLLAANDNLVV